MAHFQQHYAAVCGNGHANTQYLDRPGEPGADGVPKLCPTCSAPILTQCGCGEPILGHRSYPGVISVNRDPPPWFCHECGKPYLWATSEQVRTWVENRLRFDEDLDDDARYDLLDVLAVLTPAESTPPPMNFSRFTETLRKLPSVYADVRPFLPMLRDLFT